MPGSPGQKLAQKHRGKVVQLLTDDDPIEDDSIVIENINAVYSFGGITDTLFKSTARRSANVSFPA